MFQNDKATQRATPPKTTGVPEIDHESESSPIGPGEEVSGEELDGAVPGGDLVDGSVAGESAGVAELEGISPEEEASHQPPRRNRTTNTQPQSPPQYNYTHMPHNQPQSPPQYQYPHMSHTQPQFQSQYQHTRIPHTQFQSSPYSNMDPSTSNLNPDLGMSEDYEPTHPTYHQPQYHQTTQHPQYQTPQDPFPFYPPYSDDQCYKPTMEPHPPLTRPNFEGMGNRLYQSGSSRYGDLTDFMDPKRIDFAGPSTLPQQETRRHPARERRGRGCGTGGHYRVPGDH